MFNKKKKNSEQKSRVLVWVFLQTFRPGFCNSTDKDPGPKRLETNLNQNTALFFIIFSFFVEHSLTYFLQRHEVYRNFFFHYFFEVPVRALIVPNSMIKVPHPAVHVIEVSDGGTP